jgi:hypothetical protein
MREIRIEKADQKFKNYRMTPIAPPHLGPVNAPALEGIA